MSGLAGLVRWVWGISAVAQVVLCGVLFMRGNFRKVPIFTSYVAANLVQAILLYIVYDRIGFDKQSVIMLAWLSQACIQILRAAATTEVLRIILKPYVGIWGLGWRVLAGAFGVVFVVALMESGRNLWWAIVLADRGFHLAFGIALVACLLLVHYYSIPIHPVFKALLGGFCFYSCTVVLANTLGGTLFVRGNGNFQTIWQLATMSAFVVVLLVWAVALRTPVPEPKQYVEPQEPHLLYWETSPQINERLRLLNEQLNSFWKPEVTRH